MSWWLLAYRPLSLSELAVLAGLPLKMNLETIVKKCGSFLTIKKKTVHLNFTSYGEIILARQLLPACKKISLKGDKLDCLNDETFRLAY